MCMAKRQDIFYPDLLIELKGNLKLVKLFISS